SSNKALVVVANVRISCRRDRRPLGFGVRTHALRSFLPISNPAHRSCNSSTNPPPDDRPAPCHAVRRDHRAQESDPRALSNNRQFLSVVPSTILIHDLNGITLRSASRTTAAPFFTPPHRLR